MWWHSRIRRGKQALLRTIDAIPFKAQ